MKTLGIVGVGLVIGLGFAALAAQSPPGDVPAVKTLADADAAIHELTLRVAALEARLETMESGSASGSAAPAAASATPGTAVIKVESIETVAPTDDAVRDAKTIQQEADALDRQADSFDANAAGITIDRGADVSEATRTSARRQMNSYKSQAGEARRTAKQKRKEAESMLASRQIIRGWSGKKSVEARTDRDLSEALTGVAIGSFITGKWTLVDMDENTAIVEISSIKKVAAPAGFVERPAGSPK